MMQNCCGMRLRTAGIVLGWLGIVGSIFGTILFGVLILHREAFVSIIVDSLEGNEGTYKEQLRPQIELVLTVGLAVQVAACLINAIASAFLLAGTILERHLMLLPWLINYGFWIVVGLIYNLAHIVMWPTVPLVATFILGNAISCWIFYIIFSLYKQMKIASEEKIADRYVEFGKVEKPPKYEY